MNLRSTSDKGRGACLHTMGREGTAPVGATHDESVTRGAALMQQALVREGMLTWSNVNSPGTAGVRGARLTYAGEGPPIDPQVSALERVPPGPRSMQAWLTSHSALPDP